MVWSYAQVVALDCTYRNAAGGYEYYWDYFSFPDGYIAEPDCDGLHRQGVTQVALGSTPAQPRDDEHRLLLGAGVALASPAPTIADLRVALDAHLGGPPVTTLATDALGAARVSAVTLVPDTD